MKRVFTHNAPRSLKKKGEPKDQFVGIWFSKDTDDLLSLYSSSQRISKSVLIKDIIGFWYEEMKLQKPQIIEDLVAILQYEWRLVKTVDKFSSKEPTTFDSFSNDMIAILKRKGLDEEFIKELLNNIEQ